MGGILSLLHQWKNWINLHAQRLSQVLYIHKNFIAFFQIIYTVMNLTN